MTAAEALLHGAEALRAAGIEAPEREARLLARHALGLPQGAWLDLSAPVPEAAFRSMLSRRAAREPLAFITGSRGFWTLDLAVSPVTLIPRAETETLIEAALAAFPDRTRVRRVLDLGTGTGALLLAALAEFPAAFGVGVDVVSQAARLAAANAARNGLAPRAALLAATWGAALRGTFDLILSNPPYIESAAIPALMPEVARHEPGSALDGGPDGLAAYRAIIADVPRLLAPEGLAILELGAGQACQVAALARAAGLEPGTPVADLSGVPRALPLRRGAPVPG